MNSRYAANVTARAGASTRIGASTTILSTSF